MNSNRFIFAALMAAFVLALSAPAEAQMHHADLKDNGNHAATGPASEKKPDGEKAPAEDKDDFCDKVDDCEERKRKKMRPYEFWCGDNTTTPGQRTYGRHCTCAPDMKMDVCGKSFTVRMRLIQGPIDATKRTEVCDADPDDLMSVSGAIATCMATDDDLSDLRVEIERKLMCIQEPGEALLPICTSLKGISGRLAKVERDTKGLRSDFDHLYEKVRRYRVDFLVGLGPSFVWRTPAGPMGGGHLSAGIMGNLSPVVSVAAFGSLGLNGSESTDIAWDGGVALGAAFAFDSAGMHRLFIGPMYHQFGRTEAQDRGAIGNFLGYMLGGQVRYIGCPVGVFCLSPSASLGGGSVAGWYGDRAFEQTGFQARLALDLFFATGIGELVALKPKEPGQVTAEEYSSIQYGHMREARAKEDPESGAKELDEGYVRSVREANDDKWSEEP